MKIVRFAIANKVNYGVLENDVVAAIVGEPFVEIRYTNDEYHLKDIKLLAPCSPSKIVAVGLNYQSHIDEFRDKPALSIESNEPIIFIKPSTAVTGHGDNIVYPDSSKQLDYESELAVVIKKKASHITIEEAKDCILGYTCFNDVTARDLQIKDKQWTRGKSFDTFAPMGPNIETELDLSNTIVEGYLNGNLKQRGSTRNLVHSVPELISFISNVMTLLPGDVIATGTPEGVGTMVPGDKIEVKIEPIGILSNFVISQ